MKLRFHLLDKEDSDFHQSQMSPNTRKHALRKGNKRADVVSTLKPRVLNPSFRDEVPGLFEVAGVVVECPAMDADFRALWDVPTVNYNTSGCIYNPLHSIRSRWEQSQCLVDTRVEIRSSNWVSQNCRIEFVFALEDV